MKKLPILTLAMLFAMTGINFIDAKVACVKGFEWRNGKCRRKVKKSATTPDSTTIGDSSADDSDIDATQPTQPAPGIPLKINKGFGMWGKLGGKPKLPTTPPASPDQPTTPPTQPIMGGNSGTYAPQTFQPDAQFAGQGLIGNYFSDNQIATIRDSSGVNPASYSFTDVQAVSQSILPRGVLIGTFDTPNWVQPQIYCSGCKGKTTRLYGILVPNENSAPSTPPTQPIIGGNTQTSAPQTFQPDAKFGGSAVNGLYFSGTRIATIMNSSELVYAFKDVVTYSQAITPPKGVIIGTFDNPKYDPNRGGAGSQFEKAMLFGTLMTNEEVAQLPQ